MECLYEAQREIVLIRERIVFDVENSKAHPN